MGRLHAGSARHLHDDCAHAARCRFDVPRQFIPWRREALTPDGKLSTMDAFMLSPFLANLTPACEAAAGVLVERGNRSSLT